MEATVHWLNCAKRLVPALWLGLMLLPAFAQNKEIAKGIYQLGVIEPKRLDECSGVAPVRGATNLYWIHSDGRRPVLYAVTREGQGVRDYLVDIPLMLDWEDIATDRAGHLFVGDIGNNNAERQSLVVHQIAEPDLTKPSALLTVQKTWHLQFPGPAFDCESLFVWKDFGYVISKVFEDQPAAIYRFPLKTSEQPVALELTARLSITSPVTGADISPDGKQLAVCAKNGVYLFTIDGDPAKAQGQPPSFARFKDNHIEGICFGPDGLVVTAETRIIYLFTDRAFAKPKSKGKK